MSEAVQVAMMANGTTIVVLLLSHILFHIEHKKTASHVEKIEIATNSLKDALVLKTEQEALARGYARGYEIGHTEGRVQGIKDERNG